VLVTSENSGLIETVQNSISIHSIKKDAYAKRLNEKGFMFTLFDYFVKVYIGRFCSCLSGDYHAIGAEKCTFAVNFQLPITVSLRRVTTSLKKYFTLIRRRPTVT
jgi:hypothetical protein